MMLTLQSANSESLTFDFFPLPDKLNMRSVSSAADYIILKHLTRGLVDLNKDGEFQSQLAKSWSFSADGKVLAIELFNDQKFSNGDKISAKSVVDTISWQIGNPKGIHVDFKIVKDVKVVEEFKLKIILSEVSPRF